MSDTITLPREVAELIENLIHHAYNDGVKQLKYRSSQTVEAEEALRTHLTLVAAAEREACAKVCETEAKDHWDEMAYRALQETAELIRKRGEVKP